MAAHVPVLGPRVLEALAPRDGAVLLDATVGAGGHSALWLEASAPEGRVIAVDRDPRSLDLAGDSLKSFGDRVSFQNLPFSRLDEVLGGKPVDALLADLGVASMQLDEPERGFAIRHDGPLDMRMGADGATAADLVNSMDENDLADLIYREGDEHRSRRIARAIVAGRPMERTGELADCVARATGGRSGRLHPATKTFQALRRAVNDEAGELAALLAKGPAALLPGGRMVVLAFHSLEDRPVKNAFRDLGREGGWRNLTKKAVQADRAETADNRRARSVRMRVLERVS